MGKKIKIKSKVKVTKGGKAPVRPHNGDAGILSEKIIVSVKKKKESGK